ncbi:hypothetical protein HZH66_001948 [Vespula vulgaris]|uniref:Uncharacterized protein n=1 Tax=Vespula vulgaris TaxID=7454 RepID=A0A834KK82_VESVU|nr:hypothetical protein HZH66_001948 [Vespula vulgaris]
MEIAGLEADNRNWAIASTTYRHFGFTTNGDTYKLLSIHPKHVLSRYQRKRRPAVFAIQDAMLFRNVQKKAQEELTLTSHHVEVVASRDSRDNGDSILKSKFPDNMPVREKFGPQR